jgi:hypothetical protein
VTANGDGVASNEAAGMQDDVPVESQRIPLDPPANVERSACDRHDAGDSVSGAYGSPADDEAVGGRYMLCQMEQAQEEHLRADLAGNRLPRILGLRSCRPSGLTRPYWFECPNARSRSGNGGRSKRQALEPAHVSLAGGWM